MKIIADIVISLKILEKNKLFHGRLKMNNVHMDKSYKTRLTDYGLYNDIYRGSKRLKTKSDVNSTKTVSLSSGK